MVPPSSSDFKMIFPLTLSKFRYDRSEFSESKVGGKIERVVFERIIDEVEREVLFFRKLIIYKLISIFSLVILILFNIIGIALIILEAVKNKQKTEESFSGLAGNPDSHLLQTDDEFAELTIIGIVVLTFGVLQFLFILIAVNVLSNKTFIKYKFKVAKIFDKFNKEIFKNNEIKMIQGERCMWLEMRLDFKYNEYLANHNHNQTSWEQINALNNEIILKVSEQQANKSLLEEKANTH